MTRQFKRILKFEFEDFISSFFSKLLMLLMPIAQLYLEFHKILVLVVIWSWAT